MSDTDLIAEAQAWLDDDVLPERGPVAIITDLVAEVSALREVIEKAIHVEDEYFAQSFMWQVGKMRGILEAALVPAVPSPEGSTK
jgi:hypothetical protein